MQIRKGIVRPVRGERALAVWPPLVPDDQSTWRRRLNLYTGRGLSATALETEQNGRAGRLATRGQLRSPGVVRGLELELEGAGLGLGAAFLHIAPGYGISLSGEDVALPAPRRLPFGELPVAGFSLGDGAATLQRLFDRGRLIDLPPAAILVLRPVILPTLGELDATDSCDENEADAAFEDLQYADAALLELVPWPTAPALPPLLEDGVAATQAWRNAIADTIFRAEAGLPPGESLPWHRHGLPLGVVGFGDDWAPLFVDLASVVRAGGRPPRRTRLLPERGSPFLWQARIEQLAEQLADPSMLALSAQEAGALLRFLPPAGIIPRDAIDLMGAATRNAFFPQTFGVDAVPIPVEQLDLAIEASAALDPYDTTVPDYVRVLVPVPGHLYEPRLLLDEVIDPVFAETLDRFRGRRNELLGRRANVRAIATLYAKATDNRVLTFPDDATDTDETPTEPAGDPEQEYGTTATDGGPRAITAYEELRTVIAALPGGGQVNTPAGSKRFDELGLRDYVQRLREQIDAADDQVDIGFLRVQTDIYRIRQLVLGTDVAAKLVTSSALAAIVKDETSSFTTREVLRDYVLAAKGRITGQGGQPLGGAAAGETTPGGGVLFQPQDFNPLGGSSPVSGGSKALFSAAGATFTSTPLSSRTLVDLNRVEFAGTSIPGLRADISEATLASNVADVVGRLPIFETKRPGGDFGVIALPDNTVDEVINQQPLPGAAPVFRDTTVGQRLQQSSAELAKDNTRSTQVDIIGGLGNYSIFADLEVPYVERYDNERQRVVFDRKKIEELRANPGAITNVTPPGTDELGNFNAGIDTVDVAVGTLRAAEARIRLLREGLSKAEAALKKLDGVAVEVARRLSELAGQLAEARHDVAVGKALEAEEQARLDAITERREKILREAVSFLAYIRPRTTETLSAAPSRALDPAAVGSSVPACLQNPQTVPAELRAFVDLFRDLPIRWLVQMPRLLERIDRVELLQELIQSGVNRAKAPASNREVLFTNTAFSTGLGKAIARSYVAQQQVASSYRAALARFDAGSIAGFSWKRVRDVASETASLDDLVAAGHGNSEVARRAIAELDDIGQVAGCLHADFAEVRPALRLRWAEILSQYDDPIDLRNLANLPGWGEIAILERRAMQQQVDWLHAAVDGSVPQAVAIVNDLIRVCILLASHAPVTRLITARVALPAPVRPGGTLTLNLDVAEVKVGMQVLLYDRVDTSRVVAQAVIDDLRERQAVARVTYAARTDLNVAGDERVVITATKALVAGLSITGR